MNALIAINFQIVGHSEGWNSESDAGHTNLTCSTGNDTAEHQCSATVGALQVITEP
jgi:hypothetical protein